MRKTFLIILLICFSAIHFFAQTSCTLFEDYNTSVGWVYEDTDATGATVTTPRISIAGSSLNFINSIDGLSVTRLYKPLGFTLCNNWVAEFKFTPSSINTTHFRSTGHHLFTVTGGPLASLYSAPPLAFTNQDALGITFVSLTSTYDLNIIPLVKDGTNRTIVASCNIALDGAATIGQTYFIRMERLNSTQCRISVFRNSTMQLVGTCCFNIPSSIQNLTHLQHSNFTGGQVTRTLSGSLDSLCIKNCYSLNNVDLGNDTTICGGSYILDAGNPGSTYLWNNGSTNQTLTTTSTGSYSVQVIFGGCTYYDSINITFINYSNYLGNDTTICDGDSIIFSPSVSGGTYLWSNGSTDSVLTADTAGAFWVQITVNGCQFNDTVIVSQISPLIVNLGVDTIVCGNQLLLDAGNNGSSFIWQDGSASQTNLMTNSGLNWVSVSNGVCTARDTIIVRLVDLGFSLGNDSVLCQGEQLILSSGINAKSYLWNTGSTSPTLVAKTLGTYILNITDSVCSASDTIQINFQELTPIFSLLPVSGCEPLFVSFTDNSTTNTGAITSWEWSFGDGNSSFLRNPNHNFLSPGNYSVGLKITSVNNCQKDTLLTNVITVFPKPISSFSIVDNPSKLGEQVLFNNSSSNATSYSWFLGTTFLDTSINSNFTFDREGVFEVILISSNIFGCNDTSSQLVQISSENVLYAPNSFTPNSDDELNNEWKIISNKNITSFNLKIFNKWGELIFETQDYTEGWDGKYLGIDCQSDLYTWKATITYLDRSINQHFGHITLIR